MPLSPSVSFPRQALHVSRIDLLLILRFLHPFGLPASNLRFKGSASRVGGVVFCVFLVKSMLPGIRRSEQWLTSTAVFAGMIKAGGYLRERPVVTAAMPAVVVSAMKSGFSISPGQLVATT